MLSLSALRRDGGAFRVDGRVRLVVRGADAVRYLNGQLSNEVRGIPSGTARAALVLTPKGRICAVVHVWPDADSMVVETDAVRIDALKERLERYAIADDVEFFLPSEPAETWHVFGAAAAALDGRRIVRLGSEGIDVSAPPAGIPVAAPGQVEHLRIERGVPGWGSEVGEETLPQEAGFEANAVSFTKGCYVGQETVSRLRSVGHVNRVLRGFRGDFPARAGLELRDGAGAVAGRLTSAVADGDPGLALALGFLGSRVTEREFSVCDETGACLGRAECSEFPLVSA